MPSPPSSLTPLGFTREYQTYRAANTNIPFIDSRLLSAVRFWSRFSDALESDSYSSFWLEDLPPLLANTSSALEDLDPNELSEIAEFVSRLDATRVPATLTAASVWKLTARKWLYVGEANKALHCLAAGGLRGPELSLDLQSQSIDPPHLPNVLISELGNEHEPLKDWLTRFAAEWRAIRESGVANQAMCVLVERNVAGRPIRGRLRVLEAHVETLAKDREEDEVVFGHQLCAADDPQVRGAYSALASLRYADRGLRNTNADSHIRARFTFATGGIEPYGGDSLAFACLVSAFGDLWARDLHRERRLVSSQIALTGALDDLGNAVPISGDSLKQKIERVFFSPLSSLVVPHANRDTAEAEVVRLQAFHPNRRLRILTAERATDLVTDGNITIPERVCFGEIAVRAAKKYSRSMKVQVPILILLAAIFSWLALPKIRAILDTRLTHIALTQRGFEAKNQYDHTLWSKDYPIEALVEGVPNEVYDLDGDGLNEVLFYVSAVEPAPDDAKIDVFSTDGSFRFRLDPAIPNQYPGDYGSGDIYTPGLVQVIRVRGEPVIVTGANAQNPSRFHLRIWSANGDSLGWYVNAGVTGSCVPYDLDADGVEELIFPGYNIRMRAVSLFALNALGSYGVAPPYSDPQYDLSRVVPGNQLRYLIFPRTDITEVLGNRLYNSFKLKGLYDVTSHGFQFHVFEGEDRGNSAVENRWVVYYYLDSTVRIERVEVEDAYKARRESLVRGDSLPDIPWPEYFEKLRDTVSYWIDGQWITDCALRNHSSQ